MKDTTALGWNDRFALIDHYKPTDEQAVEVFGLGSVDELATAREMQQNGTFTATKGFDVAAYAANFTSGTVTSEKATATPTDKGTATSSKTKTGKDGSGTKSGAPAAKTGTESIVKTKPGEKATGTGPETATSRTKAEPKKRGRKGNKIATAFDAIPTSPTPVDEFTAKHNVSQTVLRQSKRFDTSGKGGQIRVRKDKESGVVMIWRDMGDAAATPKASKSEKTDAATS